MTSNIVPWLHTYATMPLLRALPSNVQCGPFSGLDVRIEGRAPFHTPPSLKRIPHPSVNLLATF